ncbi:retrovirus-related pol polyprotein from transposon TNT 1-94 [Tanacetum coccineum]
MLHSSFDMKDMGEADVILGIRIQKNSNGYILTQSHYIEKTLKKFGHYDDRPVVTPFDHKVQLKKNKDKVLEGYCDVNWISNHNEGKSTSGYVYTLAGDDHVNSSKPNCEYLIKLWNQIVALDKAAEKSKWLKTSRGYPLWPKTCELLAGVNTL